MESIFEDMHSQRLDALVGYSAATMFAMRAGIHAIGAAYAEVAEIKPRHGVKSFDRFLSNKGLDVAKLRPAWAAFVLGGRPEVLLALDWTEFDDDDHATLCMHVVTNHGRATPLFWKTVKKSELRGKRTDIELALVNAAQEAIPTNMGVTLLADRGFGSQVLYEQLDMLGWSRRRRAGGGRPSRRRSRRRSRPPPRGCGPRPARNWPGQVGGANRREDLRSG